MRGFDGRCGVKNEVIKVLQDADNGLGLKCYDSLEDMYNTNHRAYRAIGIRALEYKKLGLNARIPIFFNKPI